jgi:hypothetical protein
MHLNVVQQPDDARRLRCERELPLDAFNRHGRRADCRACQHEINARLLAVVEQALIRRIADEEVNERDPKTVAATTTVVPVPIKESTTTLR